MKTNKANQQRDLAIAVSLEEVKTLVDVAWRSDLVTMSWPEVLGVLPVPDSLSADEIIEAIKIAERVGSPLGLIHGLKNQVKTLEVKTIKKVMARFDNQGQDPTAWSVKELAVAVMAADTSLEAMYLRGILDCKRTTSAPVT